MPSSRRSANLHALSESLEESDDDECPRKRTRQACLNCRKKKVRCGGEKPRCGFCKRLSQACIYVEDGRTKRTSQSGSDLSVFTGPSSIMETMTSSFSALEDRLNIMDSAIKRIQAAKEPNEMSIFQNNTEKLGEQLIPQGPILGQLLQNTPTSLEECPAAKRRPSTDALLCAADIYFWFCHNQPYSLFHEESFRSRIMSGQLPDSLSWALLAVARRYSEIPNFSLGASDDALRCAENAWDCLALSWNGTMDHQDAVTIVQTILLIVNIENPSGNCNSAYLKLGLALRFATLYGLHKEPTAGMSFHLREESRRTFWSLYLQDRLISLSKDRFSTIRDESCTVRLPCSEIAFRDGKEEDIPTLGSFSGDNIEMTETERCSPLSLIPVMASMLDRVSLFALQDTVLSSAIAPWSPASPLNTISSVLLQLEHLFGMNDPIEVSLQNKCVVDGAMDQHLAGSFIYAKALFHLSQCLLHHPFLLGQKIRKLKQRAPPGFMKKAWKACRTHAKSITNLKSLQHHNVTAISSLYGYCTMVSGTIHVFSLMSEDESIREEGEKHYAAALDFLQELSAYWKRSALMAQYLIQFRQLSAKNFFDPSRGPGSSAEDSEDDHDWRAHWRSVDYTLLLAPESASRETSQYTDQLLTTSVFDFPSFDVFSGVDCDNLDLLPFPGVLSAADI